MGEPIIIVKDGSWTVYVYDSDAPNTELGRVSKTDGTFPGKGKKAKTQDIKKDGKDALEITFGEA